MAFLFVSTAWQRQSLTVSSTARNFAAISPEKCCEKVSLEGNVANKDFGISQKYAACKNWFMRHILWLRNRSIDRTLCEADESTNKTDSRFERGCARNGNRRHL